MSTNHFSESPWWAQHQQMMQPTMKFSPRNQKNTMACNQNTALSFNLNSENDEEFDEKWINEEEIIIPKDGLFEKPLTPSDVGKLNRLVIPKQHAEKYFPLSNSSDSGELLSFEDELGKSWKFRYSYWNSSQSYVLTKGWSRFVKEKRLDAGDVVMFERHRVESDRFFIGWRRRNTPVNPVHDGGGVAQPGMVAGGGGGWTPMYYSGHPYTSHSHGPPQLPYQPDSFHAGSVAQNQTTPSGNSKRLRLFGVNMVCEPDEFEPSTPDGSSTSSQGQPQYYNHQYHQNYYSDNNKNSNNKSHAYDHHNHMVSPHILLTNSDQE